jgi:hypothetical protein
MKYFFTHLPWGLCNQLWALFNGIMLGHSTQRDLIVAGFRPNYNSSKVIPLSQIIDLPHLNQLLRELKMRVQVHDFMDRDWKFYDFDALIKRFWGHPDCQKNVIALLTALTEPNINLGFAFFCELDKFYTDSTSWNLLMQVMSRFRFTLILHAIADQYKHILKLPPNYAVLHLRLEDDLINHVVNERPGTKGKFKESEYRHRLKARFIGASQQLFRRDDTVYVATHLLKSPNKFNTVPTELKLMFPQMIFGDSWRHHFPTAMEGREIDAIIDYLICTSASKFIGLDMSTFSVQLAYLMRGQRKPHRLVSSDAVINTLLL